MLAKKEIKELLDTITSPIPHKGDFVMRELEENCGLDDDGRMRTLVPLYGKDKEHLVIEREAGKRTFTTYVSGEDYNIEMVNPSEIMSKATKDKINEVLDKEEKVLSDYAKELAEKIHKKVEALQQEIENNLEERG